MTRINTNVSSLVAQKQLARSNSQLNVSLTRLSTGLRINTGKDDPAGLIASEMLRSDIISVRRAITNSERANQMIATADSALGQVSDLLNDIRGLVSEAANVGALSEEQIAANQLQLDSSLEAIDRIAQITSFQGRKLLDGSLDFLTSGVDNSKILDVKIDQANFGTLDAIGVDVDVVKQATKGSLNYAYGAIANDVVLEIGGKNGTEVFQFAGGSSIESLRTAINLVSDATGVEAEVQQAATKGNLTISSFGAHNDIIIEANDAGFAAGDIRVKYTVGSTGPTTATYTAATGNNPATIEVALQTEAYTQASFLVDQAGNDNAFLITANQAGADFNDVTINIVDGGNNPILINYDENTKVLELSVDIANSTVNDLIAAFGAAANEKAAAFFSIDKVEQTGGGDGLLVVANDVATTTNGTNGGAVVATADDVIAAINGNVQAAAVVTASLATGNDGRGIASAFQDVAYYGTEEANNWLQFLSPENGPAIRFVANAGTAALNVDDTTDPRVVDFSTAVYQNTVADGSLVFQAKQTGSEYDGYTIEMVDNANIAAGNEFVLLDRENKTITIHIESGNTTAADVEAAFNNDAIVGSLFEAEVFGDGVGAGAITVGAGISVTTAGGQTGNGALIVNLQTDDNGLVQTTANDLIAYFNDPANAALLQKYGISVTNVGNSDGSGLLAATDSDIQFSTSGTQLADEQASGTTYAVNGVDAQVTFTAVIAGEQYDNVKVVFQNDFGTSAGNETVSYDANSKTLTFLIEEGSTNANQIVTALGNNAELSALFTADVVGTGAGLIDTDDGAILTGGVVDAGSAEGAALLGNSDLANLGLTFRSTTYGSNSFVSVRSLAGEFNLTDTATGNAADRSTGTDVNARINGIQAIGNGLAASINTAALDIAFTVSDSVASGSKMTFAITGGGAQFQLGPDVVSNQQARLGIRGVSTAKLGGVNGKLFELRSGGAKSLTNDVSGAARLIDEVIAEVTSLRGRLGAFQRTTLETNIYTLSDTLENLSTAESSIRDADFAAESANLTRAQILVQSGISTLSIANSNPQNVLALLR